MLAHYFIATVCKLASAWGEVVPSAIKAPIPYPVFQLFLSPPAPDTAKYDLPGPTKEPRGDTSFLSQL